MGVVQRAAAVMAAATCLAGGAHAQAPAAGISVPPGFVASVVFDGQGPARHIAVRANGDIYLSTRGAGNPAAGAVRGGILALRDADGDGRYEQAQRFGDVAGTGLRFHGGELYATSASTLYRYRFAGDELVPHAAPEVIVSGMPEAGFASRAIAFDDKGGVFIGIGASGNACMDKSTPPRGADPCPDLAARAGIWRYSAERTGQQHPSDGERWATGIRDLQGLDWDGRQHALFATMQGRNGLDRAGAKTFSALDNAGGVADELHRVAKGADFGWPYTHFDGRVMGRVKAPEYGGAPGDLVKDAAYDAPVAALPSHSSPLDVAAYEAAQFPAAYRGGLFVALQGGSDGDRAQNGYQVLFVPRPPRRGFAQPVVFADGFAGAVHQPQGAEHRPSGLAVGPDGSLFVVDAKTGRVWRIRYVGRR